MDQENVLDAAERAMKVARNVGADEVEVYAEGQLTRTVELQKNDLHQVSSKEEVCLGLRLFRRGAEGFATTNDPSRVEAACRRALQMTSLGESDPHAGPAIPRPVEPLEDGVDERILQLDLDQLAELAASLVRCVQTRDRRVQIDWGQVGSRVTTRAIATSTGIRLAETNASAGVDIQGMVIEGGKVGPLDRGKQWFRQGDLAAAIDAVADGFVRRALGALVPQRTYKAESFYGSVIFAPSVFTDFILGLVLNALDASGARTGRSALTGKLGTRIASELVSLWDDGRTRLSTGSAAFDREGTPTRRYQLVDRGVLCGYLYDVYEARRAGIEPTGHAGGGASHRPKIGPHHPSLVPGKHTLEALLRESDRTLLVGRVSGTAEPHSGDFSGVIKGGLLFSGRERVPIQEMMISGNVYRALRDVSAITASALGQSIPAVRVEGISVTAG